MHHYIYFSFVFFILILSLVAFLTVYQYKKNNKEFVALKNEKNKTKKSTNSDRPI